MSDNELRYKLFKGSMIVITIMFIICGMGIYTSQQTQASSVPSAQECAAK